MDRVYYSHKTRNLPCDLLSCFTRPGLHNIKRRLLFFGNMTWTTLHIYTERGGNFLVTQSMMVYSSSSRKVWRDPSEISSSYVCICFISKLTAILGGKKKQEPQLSGLIYVALNLCNDIVHYRRIGFILIFQNTSVPELKEGPDRGCLPNEYRSGSIRWLH